MPTDDRNDYTPVPVAYSEGPYDTFVNNAFDQIAIDRVVSGPIADRPSPGLFAPQRWYATDPDEKTEYFNTGSTWEPLGDSNSNTSSGPANTLYLSDFTSLETAIDQATSDGDTLVVDGSFTFTESNIPITEGLRMRGTYGVSRINIDVSDTANPLFHIADTTSLAEHLSMEGIYFTNTNGQGGTGGGCGSFLTSDSGSALFVQSFFKDLFIDGFNGTYAFDIANAYTTYFENVHVENHTVGGFRFDNCNASYMISPQVHNGGDGTTPAFYFTNCGGVSVFHPYTEGPECDAIIQTGGSTEMTFIGGYHEAHDGSYDCVYQIGDGGETAGNTNGSTADSSVKIFGGFSRRSDSTTGQAVRLLNVKGAIVDGLHIGSHDVGVQVGNANGFSVTTTNISRATARNLSFFQVPNRTAAGTNVDFVYESGEIWGNRPANGDLSDGEYTISRNGGAGSEAELYYKRDGTVNRWTADGTF